jgi:hypothetical protein
VRIVKRAVNMTAVVLTLQFFCNQDENEMSAYDRMLIMWCLSEFVYVCSFSLKGLHWVFWNDGTENISLRFVYQLL